MLTLSEVKKIVYDKCHILGVDIDSDPYFAFELTRIVEFGGAYIDIEGSKYSYIVMERGKVIRRYDSENLDDILFYLFNSITQTLVTKYCASYRRENPKIDTRIIWYPKQLELLEKVNSSFVEMRHEKMREVLEESPLRHENGQPMSKEEMEEALGFALFTSHNA